MAASTPCRLLTANVLCQWARLLRHRRSTHKFLGSLSGGRVAAVAQVCWLRWRTEAGKKAVLKAEMAGRDARNRCLVSCLKAFESVELRPICTLRIVAATWQAWQARVQRKHRCQASNCNLETSCVDLTGTKELLHQLSQRLACNMLWSTSDPVAKSFCCWRLATRRELRQRIAQGEDFRLRQQGDVQTLVDLLQQSTHTCKDLRVSLLEARRGSRHAAWLYCVTVMRAWQTFIRLHSHGHLGVLPPMPTNTQCIG